MNSLAAHSTAYILCAEDLQGALYCIGCSLAGF